jgi:hypothetical protein
MAGGKDMTLCPVIASPDKIGTKQSLRKEVGI